MERIKEFFCYFTGSVKSNIKEDTKTESEENEADSNQTEHCEDKKPEVKPGTEREILEALEDSNKITTHLRKVGTV